MNFGVSDKLMLSFPNVIPLNRPTLIPSDEPLNPFLIIGFVEGDGTFFVTINSKTNQVKPGTSIGLNIREEFLLVKIKNFFDGIGSIYTSPSHNLAEWKVFKFSNF